MKDWFEDYKADDRHPRCPYCGAYEDSVMWAPNGIDYICKECENVFTFDDMEERERKEGSAP